MAIAHIPLTPNLENRTSSLSKDSKLVNGYVEQDGDKKRSIKRQGYGYGTLYESGVGQGVVNYLNVLRVFVNNKFYKSNVSSTALDLDSEPIDIA